MSTLQTWRHTGHAGTIRAGGQPPLRGPTIAGQASAPASTQPPPGGEENEVHGITPAARLGTCFRTPPNEANGTPNGSINLTRTACANLHTFELLAIEQASGSLTYPDAAYWQGPVTQACQQAFAAYTGRRGGPPGSTADGRASTFFRPLRTGWAQGDRTVYCLAHSHAAIAGSVRASAR